MARCTGRRSGLPCVLSSRRWATACASGPRTGTTSSIHAAGSEHLAASPLAVSANDAAAEALAKKSGCFKCHAVSAKKDGPSFKETAGKYKGKADAEASLVKHLTTNPKVKVDGKEETHDSLKTKNPDDVKNVARWILSR